MSLRRAVGVAIASAIVLALHVVLVRVAAHEHVAHVLLGAGNGAPPAAAAFVATALVALRFAAIVIVPGALFASAASVAAHLVVGPRSLDDEAPAPVRPRRPSSETSR